MVKDKKRYYNVGNLLLSISIVLYIFLFLPSCKKGYHNNRKLSDKLVVFAELTAEDSLKISIGKSLVVGNGRPITFEKISNADVAITTENETPKQLTFNISPDFLYNQTAIYSHAGTAKFNTSYLLAVKEASLGTATALTKIPGPFSVTNVTTEEDGINGENVFVFSFSINDPANEKNYYIFEAVKQLVQVSRFFYWQGVLYNYDTQAGGDLYNQVKDEPDVHLVVDTIGTNNYIRLNLFTHDIKTDNEDFASLDSSFRRIFITDSTFNGQVYSSQFAVSMTYFETDKPEEAGRVLIQIKSVTKDLYDYLSDYEKYKSDFGSIPTGQLTSPPGNINNGLGVFGGVSKKEWKYYFDDLE